MQYAVEHKQVRDCISVALRQTRGHQQVSRNVEEPSASSESIQKGQSIHFPEEHTW